MLPKFGYAIIVTFYGARPDIHVANQSVACAHVVVVSFPNQAFKFMQDGLKSYLIPAWADKINLLVYHAPDSPSPY